MDKQTFLQELDYRLRHMPEEDKLDAIEYYSEYIDDLNLPPECDICVHLGSPKEVARQIIADTTERKIDEQQEKNTTKGFGSIIWLVILGIFASPIALPLAIGAIAIIFAGLITIGSVVFALGVSGISCVISGIAMFFTGFFTGELGLAQTFINFGEGLVVLGLGILLTILTVILARCFVSLISSIIKKRLSKNKARKAQEA
ncbi:MAG: DUF1700 domain-containing protein [Lachnospiraceae bacterium]|nr:DUF1700 domain-containing protein [Lachnospiraceae bacterium]